MLTAVCCLTEHVDNLSPAVIDRAQSLIVQSPDSGPPHIALARPPDHDDHVGVEIYEETDGQNKECDKGELMYWIPLKCKAVLSVQCRGQLTFG